MDRRKFMKITGTSVGMGVLYKVLPAFGATPGLDEVLNFRGGKTGEKVAPFTFLQLSDAHVGFNGPPDPLGTKAFERAVELVNKLPNKPELVLFTGDLTHDSEDKDVHAGRMKQRQAKVRVRRRRRDLLFLRPPRRALCGSGQCFAR